MRNPSSFLLGWLMILPMAGGSSLAFAQDRVVAADLPDTERRQVVPFLEGTDVFASIPASGMRFEADIQPNLVVSQNFSDKLIIDASLTGAWRVAYSIVGTPRVRLRMFEERSAPVRTPSYMPKGSLALLFFRGEKQEPAHRVGIWSPQLTVGHHSNGQDGCLFETDTLVGDECVGTPDLSRINRKDGSFSTNFVRLGGRYRREWLTTINPGEAGEEHVGRKHVTVGLDVDLHFRTDERIAPFYGRRRVRASFEAAQRLPRVCRSRAVASASVTYVGREPAGVPPVAFQVEGLCTFTPQGGWGLFGRYYDGQDYYNLGFTERIRRFHVGVRYDNDGFLRFITSEAKAAIDDRRRRRENAR